MVGAPNQGGDDDLTVQPVDHRVDPASSDDEVEKIATALEYLGNTGIQNLIKTAGTHHRALASNSSAQSYTKAEKGRNETGNLSPLLRARPFADGDHPVKKPGIDKNVNAGKRKKAGVNVDALRLELASRMSGATV